MFQLLQVKQSHHLSIIVCTTVCHYGQTNHDGVYNTTKGTVNNSSLIFLGSKTSLYKNNASFRLSNYRDVQSLYADTGKMNSWKFEKKTYSICFK